MLIAGPEHAAQRRVLPHGSCMKQWCGGARRWHGMGPGPGLGRSRNAPRPRLRAASARRRPRPQPRRRRRGTRTATACSRRRSLPPRTRQPRSISRPRCSWAASAALPGSWAAATRRRRPARLRRSAPSPACPCTDASRRPCARLMPSRHVLYPSHRAR